MATTAVGMDENGCGMLGILMMIPGSVGSDALGISSSPSSALPHKGSPAMRTEELAAQEGDKELSPSLC